MTVIDLTVVPSHLMDEVQNIKVSSEDPYPVDPNTIYLVWDQTAGYNSQPEWLGGRNPLPVIASGVPEGFFPNDPSISWDGSKYVGYFGTSAENTLTPPIKVVKMTSPDGQDWTLVPNTNPPTYLLDEADTEFEWMETPNVVFFKGEYHMYTTGSYAHDAVPLMGISHATSKDGVTWVSDPGSCLAATGNPDDWDGFLVAEPGAVVRDGQIWLYFAAFQGVTVAGEPPQKSTIGLATSNNGTDFSSRALVLSQDFSTVWPREKGFAGYSTPSVVIRTDSDGVDWTHLTCNVAAYDPANGRAWHQCALVHAVTRNDTYSESETWLHPFLEDENPMLLRDDFANTTGGMIGPDCVIKDGKVQMWFTGQVNQAGLVPLVMNNFVGPEIGIGYAEVDESHWEAAETRWKLLNPDL